MFHQQPISQSTFCYSRASSEDLFHFLQKQTNETYRFTFQLTLNYSSYLAEGQALRAIGTIVQLCKGKGKGKATQVAHASSVILRKGRPPPPQPQGLEQLCISILSYLTSKFGPFSQRYCYQTFCASYGNTKLALQNSRRSVDIYSFWFGLVWLRWGRPFLNMTLEVHLLLQLSCPCRQAEIGMQPQNANLATIGSASLPYSPWFNPIEGVFSVVKRHYYQSGSCTHRNLKMHNRRIKPSLPIPSSQRNTRVCQIEIASYKIKSQRTRCARTDAAINRSARDPGLGYQCKPCALISQQRMVLHGRRTWNVTQGPRDTIATDLHLLYLSKIARPNNNIQPQHNAAHDKGGSPVTFALHCQLERSWPICGTSANQSNACLGAGCASHIPWTAILMLCHHTGAPKRCRDLWQKP
eukprot:1160080-Pelagomonas_calceolata.AAC.6